MPGILPRAEAITKAPMGMKTAANVLSEATVEGDTHELKMGDYRNGYAQTNGDHGFVNGIHTNGIPSSPTSVERKTSTAIKKLVGQLPPEIKHVTFGYVPFSSLISRLVQETFNDLTDVINDMSDMPVSQPSQSASHNHIHQQSNGNGDTSQANVQKKLRMLHFASERRAQFIKILILSRWARQVEAVSKVIDLNFWLSNHIGQYNECCSWMGELKRRLIPLREPNPDIKTALEVLSLGKASWLSDLGYLSPEPLAPRKFVNALRRINTLLSIRLNLQENIPPVFRDYSISSGRATFHVVDEFEVDLSVAEEDASSQLYFIDFRFAFSPTLTELPAGRLRNQIEGRANDVLRHDGLQGLFDFLHNLVLTHKLLILRNQAQEMARSYWSEYLQVEAVHRSVVVQYWSNRPGGKSWIEIGLKRGKEIRLSYSPRSQRMPHIALRWFRNGKEIQNVTVEMRLGELSLLNIVKQIIALHTNHIFQEMAAKINMTLLYSGGFMRCKCNSSTTEPLDVSLLVQLTTSKAVKVVQEPVSGRFAVLPASRLNSRAENDLNRLASPATEGASQLAHLRSIASQEEVDASARSMGWEAVRSLSPGQETMQRLFPKDTQRTRFFRRQAWSAIWILAFTTGLEGDAWWIVELMDKVISMESATGPRLRAAYMVVYTDPQSFVTSPSLAALAQIERTAAGMISQLNDTRHLATSKIPHKLQLSAPSSAGIQTRTIYFRFSGERALPLISTPSVSSLPWANEMVKLDYRGLDSSNTSAIHMVSARMRKPVSNIKDLISAIPSIFFHPTSGAFTFQILAKVGETTIPNITRRLSAIGLLLDFVSIIQLHQLSFRHASLIHIQFVYNKVPSLLKATIHFPPDEPIQVSLPKSNPHLRIADYLTARLKPQGLTSVIGIMRMTLPLVRALAAVETVHIDGGVEVLTRSEQWYQVRYSAPYSKGGFEVRLQQRRDELMWLVPEPNIKKKITGNEALEEDLRSVLRGKGDGWRGMTSGGIVADQKGVENLIARLDEIFSTDRYTPSESNPKKRKADGDVVEID
ncbi:MAG: mediator complex subunit [Alectoria sarmentosa]|nr:MAG: mediator complex subunit [Alectoria sarmentosa]CAD6591190.1 MAG: mediator complex subunit [Alectoria sarmentosa]